MSVAVIIPARFESSRFPGKLLQNINGKPMLWWTIDCVQKLNFIDKIVVAASDNKIIEYVKDFPGLKTELFESASCGTEKTYRYFTEHRDFDYYISIPADEPALNPREVNRIWPIVRERLAHNEIATLYSKFHYEEDLGNHLTCKIVADKNDNAMYFSRNIIPATKSGKLLPLESYKKHVGVFVFPGKFFKEGGGPTLWWGWDSFTADTEGLEQNRFLEAGATVKLFEINHPGLSIDSPEQIKQLEERIESGKI